MTTSCFDIWHPLENIRHHRSRDEPERIWNRKRAKDNGLEIVKKAKGKPKRTAAEQVEDEAVRKALNPIGSRQTISDDQAEPEFQENYKCLKSDRLAREAELKAKGK
jgi:hypothetical protein